MRTKQNTVEFAVITVALFLLIMDAKTASAGIYEGIQICITTAIPSLFPFIVLIAYLNSRMSSNRLPLLSILGKHIGIPSGAESLLCFSFIGGYPIGAQCVSQLYTDGKINQKTAERLLGFCSNAGPSFIFGMTAVMFSSIGYAWMLWGIQIVSALIVGLLLPGKENSSCTVDSSVPIKFTKCVENSIKSMALICGWIILFRMVIKLFQVWVLWLFSREIQIVVIGILELANGCCELRGIENEGLRFVVCSGLLCFGGISVLMQTQSVCKNIRIHIYLLGKIAQCFISIFFAYMIQAIWVTDNFTINLGIFIIPAVFAVFSAFTHKIISKKPVAIPT